LERLSLASPEPRCASAHRSSVAAVEDLEGVVVSVGYPLEQALVLTRRIAA
jgi:hypothetical protein